MNCDTYKFGSVWNMLSLKISTGNKGLLTSYSTHLLEWLNFDAPQGKVIIMEECF